MAFDATFWVAVSFVVLIGILYYYRVHVMIGDTLKARSERIRAELDEARRLREEAQGLLATYERKQRDAMKEAEAMVTHAREAAARESESARRKAEEAIERRQQSALERIALAEAQAEREVRAAAVEVAVKAAETVIARHLSADRARQLVDDSIKDLRRNLH